MTRLSELYNKGLLIMWTMSKFKVNKEKATRAVEQFLTNEDKRVPNVDKLISQVLSEK